jgi:hypothetical protein
MEILTLDEAKTTFRTLFQSANHTMFKAEVLQDYTAVDDCPSLRAWVAGNRDEARALGRTNPNTVAWRERCLKSPADITRVHAVQEPYTSYLEWEIDISYKRSLIAFGAETVLLASLGNLANVQLPAGDFWIFDDQQVLQWEYEDGVGKTVGAQLWDEGRGDNIDVFRQLRETLLSVAEPVT